MILNDAGKIVRNEWVKSAEIRKEIEIHEFAVMPNHFPSIVGFKTIEIFAVATQLPRTHYSQSKRICYIATNPTSWQHDGLIIKRYLKINR